MYRGSSKNQGMSRVSTILTPNERLRVDAAGEGLYYARHRDSVDEVIRDLKEYGSTAVLMSVSRCSSKEATGRLATMVREFPRIPAVALLTELGPQTPQTVLSLGRSGIEMLIDVRSAAGWHELRSILMADRASDIQRLALAQLSGDLTGVPLDCWRFFEVLFRCSSRVNTVRLLAEDLVVLPSTLMSRFFRARLPAPKRYLAMARLVRAASLFENTGLSVANVSNHLDYSSPQSFGRHVRTLLRITAVDFRQSYDGEGMLHRFREELVLPHLSILRVFSPLTGPPGWMPTVKRLAAPVLWRQ
jgi:AraC-like DNA-binding protein